jgi:hypothetical protein
MVGDIDIFEYCGNNIYKSWVIRFDPKVYKVPMDDVVDKFELETDGWNLVTTVTKMLADVSLYIDVWYTMSSCGSRFTMLQ